MLSRNMCYTDMVTVTTKCLRKLAEDQIDIHRHLLHLFIH